MKIQAGEGLTEDEAEKQKLLPGEGGPTYACGGVTMISRADP